MELSACTPISCQHCTLQPCQKPLVGSLQGSSSLWNRQSDAHFVGWRPPLPQTLAVLVTAVTEAVAAAGSATGPDRVSSAKAINAKIVAATGPSAILCVLEDHAADFSLINIATALHRLAKTMTRRHRRRVAVSPHFGRLEARLCEELKASAACSDAMARSGPALAQILWSQASQSLLSPGSLQVVLAFLCAAAPTLVPSLGARETVLIVWSLAKLECRPGAFLGPLLQSLAGDGVGKGAPGLRQHTSRDLAQLAWSLGALAGMPGPAGEADQARRILSDVADVLHGRQLRDLGPRGLANLLQALADSQLAGHRVFGAAAMVLASHPPSPDDGPAWAMSARDAACLLRSLSLHHAAVAGPGAACHTHLQRALDALLLHLSRLVPGAGTHEVTTVAWALATLQHRRPNVLTTITDRACQLVQEGDWDVQAVSKLCWACARLSFDAPAFFDAVARLAPSRLFSRRQPEARTLALLLGAYATLGRCSGEREQELFRLAVPACTAAVHGMTCEHLINLAWSYCVAGLYPPEFFSAWRLALALQAHRLSHQDLQKLFLVEAALQLEAASASGIGKPEDFASFFQGLYEAGRLRNMASKEWDGQRRRGAVHTSSLQKQVFAALQELGLAPLMEEWREGQYSIDIAIPTELIAVEVDGPTHFPWASRRVLGKTALKRRLLTAMGWRVLPVPFYDWPEAGLEAQAAYMRSRLAGLGLPGACVAGAGPHPAGRPAGRED
ncbi:hypothetical protein ACKKBG_A00045 [Auxenochlorella protothecoides x Auxenochlorella symbiontica]